MKRRLLSLLLAGVMIGGLAGCTGEEPLPPDRTVQTSAPERPRLEDDYYGYVNYKFLTTTEIPFSRDEKYTSDWLQDDLEKTVSDIVDRNVKKKSSGGNEGAVREIYEQYSDTKARDAAGVKALMPAVRAIEDSKTPDEFVSALALNMRQYGVASFLNFNVTTDSYDHTRNRVVLLNMFTCGNMKENFTKTDAGLDDVGKRVEDTLSALGTPKAQTKERARKVIRMLYEIMLVTTDSDKLDNVELHYNITDRKAFAKTFSNIDTDAMLKSFGLDVKEINLFEPEQAKKINEYFTKDNLRALKDYALSCIMFIYGRSLPPSYFSSSSGDDDMTEADKDAKTYVSDLLEEETGILYGKEICTDKVMTAAEKMVDDIKKSYKKLIQSSGRYSDDAKKKLLKKLDSLVLLLGYNKEYTSPFRITAAKDGGTLLANAVAVYGGKARRKLDKIKQKPDRRTWDMTPVTVNAVYNPAVNTVTIPAVMLSSRNFDVSKGESWCLGMLGYVIGHEISHAFDSNGIKYNEYGEYSPEWISKKDSSNYKTLQEKAIRYYDDYKILDFYRINGEQTLGENLADIASVECISGIINDKKELKKMFEAVASQWGTLSTVEAVVNRISIDEHSPAEARVNAVLSSVDKFYDVYEIKETDKMYVSPENRIKVW